MLTPGQGALAVLSAIYTLVRGTLQFLSQGSILSSFHTFPARQVDGGGEVKSWVQDGLFIVSVVLDKVRPLQAYSEKWGCLEPSMGFWLEEGRTSWWGTSEPQGRPLLASGVATSPHKGRGQSPGEPTVGGGQ